MKYFTSWFVYIKNITERVVDIFVFVIIATVVVISVILHFVVNVDFYIIKKYIPGHRNANRRRSYCGFKATKLEMRVWEKR